MKRAQATINGRMIGGLSAGDWRMMVVGMDE
jgi:hypothetical protein